jgi:hypothetical protein
MYMVNVTILSTISGSISNFCSHLKENFLISISTLKNLQWSA